MRRIEQVLADQGTKKLLVPFFTSGYPGHKQALDLVKAGLDAGADMIEVGMPFSDPMADGPEIQFSSAAALAHGTSMADTWRLVEAARGYSDRPIVLMGYFNPILAIGVDRFAEAVLASGADGLIIPDLPFEEAAPLARSSSFRDLSMLHLVAPTTSTNRLRGIERACTDLVYAVTVTGVTGSGSHFDHSTDIYLRGLRERLTKPFVAGFGVSSPESASRLARYANGVVIGSALIRIYRRASSHRAGVRAVAGLLGRIRKSLG